MKSATLLLSPMATTMLTPSSESALYAVLKAVFAFNVSGRSSKKNERAGLFAFGFTIPSCGCSPGASSGEEAVSA